MIAIRPQYELFRPLVAGWIGKIEKSIASRKRWRELADECNMFYSKSAAAMWDPKYERKFWRNVKAPRFRITINKAFELVAVFGPSLFWEVPHRTVESKKPLDISPELFQSDQMAMQIYQQLMSRQQQEQATDKVVSTLMQTWLNYTPREQPGGGLANHGELATVDALVKGRGVLWVRPYQFPSSGRTLTGCFREPPENLLIDPDFNSIDDAKWIALRHVDPHWAVERRFKLPANSLKEKATLESAWAYGETMTQEDISAHRVAGQTNDLVVWYEIWSKTGPGARLTGMETIIKEHLEDTVGDYAYLAISANVPYPLNMSNEKARSARDDEVKEAFSWPVPTWADDRWPCEVLDFYPETNSAWPIPPLAPAMGELKLLNFLIPWLAQRVWSSSRDFWAVAGPHVEKYRKYLTEGLDQTILDVPSNVEDVRKAIQIIQQPETRADVWRIIELVSEMFDKRTGLTDFAYGKNEGGTQNRTAEETQAKARAVGVRPEHMQKKVVRFHSRLAGLEGFVTRWFVKGEDVEPLLGPVGRYLWEKYIMSTDVELVVRQMQYSISASSIRRPDRDRDIANYQQVLTLFAPIIAQYGQTTGNYDPFNYLMKKWAEFHDADLDGAMLPPPQTNEQQQQMQQQQMQMEMQKLQADLQGKKMDLQGKTIDIQGRQMDAQLKQAMAQMNVSGQQQKLIIDSTKAAQDLQQDQSQHELDMVQDQQVHLQDLLQTRQMGNLKLQLASAQSRESNKNGDRNGR